ncbi:hypothetical protein F5Y17DRAFT_54667 [Xylariaceae sp. FL0594]|nr:hypothetical protein F5Y17DRAFT_54667 [Xylariaceae sp. FL0594]
MSFDVEDPAESLVTLHNLYGTQLPDPPREVSFDAKADLCLVVSTAPNTTTFAVCSRDLERASPVWDRMLNGSFKESKNHSSRKEEEKWTIEFPDDDPRVMRIILGMIHGRFDMVPTYDPRSRQACLTVSDIYDITMQLDKYDMMHLTRPWAAGWMSEMQRAFKKELLWERDLYPRDFWPAHRRCLWLAWMYGDFELFKTSTENLTMHLDPVPDCPGMYMDFDLFKTSFKTSAENLTLHFDPIPGSQELDWSERARLSNANFESGILEPLNMYELITNARPAVIEKVFSVVDKIVHDLAKNDKTLCTKKKKQHPSWGLCIATMLGKTIQSLYSMGMWPLPKAADRDDTVTSLVRILKDHIELVGYGGERHKCSRVAYLGERIDAAVKQGMPAFLDAPGVREHLQAQSKKTGLSCTPELWEAPPLVKKPDEMVQWEEGSE